MTENLWITNKIVDIVTKAVAKHLPGRHDQKMHGAKFAGKKATFSKEADAAIKMTPKNAKIITTDDLKGEYKMYADAMEKYLAGRGGKGYKVVAMYETPQGRIPGVIDSRVPTSYTAESQGNVRAILQTGVAGQHIKRMYFDTGEGRWMKSGKSPLEKLLFDTD